MKRKTVLVASGFFVGSFVSFYLETDRTIIIMAAVLICTVLSLFVLDSKRKTCMLLMLSFLASSAYSVGYTVSKVSKLEALENKTVSVSGVVIDYTPSDRSMVTVSGEIDGIRCKFLTYVNNFSGELSDEVSFTGKVSKLENSYYFKSRDHYHTDGVFVTVSVLDDLTVTSGKVTPVLLLRRYSMTVSEKLRYYADADAGDVLCAMICGDSGYMSDPLRLTLNRAGIGHVGAVSGLHLTVVAFSLLFVMKKLRCPRLVTAFACEAAVISFLIFSGMRISCIRAAIMMSVYILSTLVRRKTDPLNTLCVAALIIMLLNPYAAADTSFCLSIAGTYGVSVAAPYVVKLFKPRNLVVKTLMVCTCAYICTMPLCIVCFNELSMIAPFMNLVLVPMCSAATVLGMLFCVLGAASSLSWLVLIAGKLMEGVIAICERATSSSIAYLPTGLTDVYLCVAIIAVLALVSYLLLKNKKLVMFSFIIGFCFFVLTTAVNLTADKNVQIDVLTSGANCCVLLRKNQECIIIDFDSGKMADECETVTLKNGINGIRAVIISGNGEAGYSAYSELSVKPDVMYLPKGSYIFGGDIGYSEIPESCSIFDLDISLRDDLLIISHGANSIAVSNDSYYEIGTINVCVLDGVAIVNSSGERSVYKGDTVISFELT